MNRLWLFRLVLVAVVVGCWFNSGASAQLLGPTPYLQFADSPFATVNFVPGYFYLEDLEDNSFNVPGVTRDFGWVLGPGGSTDSVDADDGVIDGHGNGGHSLFFEVGPTGISFTFHADQLGHLPSHAAIVWTDGANSIHFEAFDINGVSVGQVTGAHADGSISGTTAEDRFYGVVSPCGVSRIHIWNNSGGIEVDHLQYGYTPLTNVGNMNCDCIIDFDDINPFVDALSDPAFYQQQYPDCNILNADCNGDGDINFDDINPFVEILSGG